MSICRARAKLIAEGVAGVVDTSVLVAGAASGEGVSRNLSLTFKGDTGHRVVSTPPSDLLFRRISVIDLGQLSLG